MGKGEEAVEFRLRNNCVILITANLHKRFAKDNTW